jgi:hypothetical protein
MSMVQLQPMPYLSANTKISYFLKSFFLCLYLYFSGSTSTNAIFALFLWFCYFQVLFLSFSLDKMNEGSLLLLPLSDMQHNQQVATFDKKKYIDLLHADVI